MYKILNCFFWGLLLIIFNFYLGFNSWKIDLLPNTVGYILIGIAFQALAVKEAKFEKGIWCVGISLILHVVQLCMGSQTEYIGVFNVVVVLAVSGLQLAYLFYMHEAVTYIIDTHKEEHRLQSVREKNKTNWKITLGLGIASCICVAVAMSGSYGFLAISAVPVIGMVIVQIVFLCILNRIKKEIDK